MRILIVDDDDFSLDILHGVLGGMGCEVLRAKDGKEALARLRLGDIHLVITDWEMPTMNGLELCRAIRDEDFDGYVYIIMLTGRDSGQQKIEGLHAGADAFLIKPLNPDELLVSLKTAERILGLETRDLAMFALAKLSESRDPETGAHIERVQSYARLLAQYLSTTENHSRPDRPGIRPPDLSDQPAARHRQGGNPRQRPAQARQAHRPTKWRSCARTPALGAQTLEASLQRFPNVRFLQMARDIALSHHERWDGNGYPQRTDGRGDPAGRAHRRAGRCLRCADQPARVSRCDDPLPGQGADPSGARIAFRSGCGRCVSAVEKQFIAIRERFRDDEPERSQVAAAKRREFAG